MVMGKLTSLEANKEMIFIIGGENSLQFSPALGIKCLNTLDFDLVYLVFYHFFYKTKVYDQ